MLGGYAGWKSPIPSGALIGGVVLGFAVKGWLGHSSVDVHTLSVLAQLLISYVIVSRTSLENLALLRRLFVLAFMYNLILYIVSFGASFLLASFTGMDVMTALFATPPGGLSSLGIIAAEMDVEVPVTLLFHVIRVTLIVCLVPMLAVWLKSRYSMTEVE